MHEIALPKRDTPSLQPTSLSLSLLLPSPERGLESHGPCLPSVTQERIHVAEFIGAADSDC